MSATVHTTIRVHADELAEIDQHAQAYGMSRTAFLVKSALKRLPEHESDLEQRINALERTIEKHSRLLELATNSY